MLAPIDWPSSAVASRDASTKWLCAGPASAAMVRLIRAVGSENSGLRVNSPGSISASVDHHGGGAGLDCGEHLAAAGDHHVAAEHEVGAARRDADRVDIFGTVGEADVARHRTALLREAGHVDEADALAFEMRRHAENRADGDDAGTADAGDDDPIGLIDRRQRRLRQRRRIVLGRSMPLPRLSLAPSTVTKDGQKPFRQEIVLVAAGLVDGALAAEFGFERLHRDAVRFDAAIAAALADQLIDDDALVRDRETGRACGGGASRRRRSGRRSARCSPALRRVPSAPPARSSR